MAAKVRQLMSRRARSRGRVRREQRHGPRRGGVGAEWVGPIPTEGGLEPAHPELPLDLWANSLHQNSPNFTLLT